LTDGRDATVADRNVGVPNFARIDIDNASASDDDIGRIPAQGDPDQSLARHDFLLHRLEPGRAAAIESSESRRRRPSG
jgi:hypothetical protein